MSVKFKESYEQSSSGPDPQPYDRGFRGRTSGPRNGRDGDYGTERRSYRERDFAERDGGGGEKSRGFFGFGRHHDRHEIAHDIGEAITKGEGKGGYLQAYLKQLESNPLRTKMLTSGTLSGLQEILASWIAQDRNKNGHYFTSRVPKMAVYGAIISAPMGHFLIKILQKVFADRTSLKAKILQIVVSNLIVAPIQNSIYLVSMAIIAGARTFHQVRATVRAGFMPVMKVSWISSPIALAFAQQFLPQEAWVPFFNVVAFVIGTYINAHTKKKRLAALRRKRYDEGRGEGRGEYSSRTEYAGPAGYSGSTGTGYQADVRSDVRTERTDDYSRRDY